MFLSVNLRPASRKLPFLGVHRSVNDIICLFLGDSWITHHLWGVQTRSMIFSSSPTIVIRRPLLAKGTKAACLDLIAVLTISGHCYSAIRPCFYVFRGPKYRVDYHPQFPNPGSVSSPKSLHFQACFQKLKNQKSGSQGLQKLIKDDSEI